MPWMIYLAKEKEIGKGCRDCRFLNDLKEKAECIADSRVDVYDGEEVDQYRPYTCPFRYYEDHVDQITKRLDGMTEEKTEAWFAGANRQAQRYVDLENDRDRYVKYLMGKQT